MSRRSSKQSVYAEDPADEAVARRLSRLSQFRDEYPGTPGSIRSTYIVDPTDQHDWRIWRDWTISASKYIVAFFVGLSAVYMAFYVSGTTAFLLVNKFTAAIDRMSLAIAKGDAFAQARSAISGGLYGVTSAAPTPISTALPTPEATGYGWWPSW